MVLRWTEYIFGLDKLTKYRDQFTWTNMTVKVFVQHRLSYHSNVVSHFPIIFWDFHSDFIILVLCFYFTEYERGTTQFSSPSCPQAVKYVTREELNNGYDCIMLKIVTKKYENYSRDEHPLSL